MNLYKKYLSIHLKSELEYKSSFIISLIAQAFVTFSSYFVILGLFSKFGNLKGYTIYQVMIIYGIIHLGFSINEVFNRGFDHFDKLIINGDLDRILTRPRNIYLQILGFDIDYSKLTRIIENFIILLIGIIKVNIIWNPLKILTIIFMIISSIIVFFSIYLIGASFCFITTEGLEIKNIFTDGGRDMASYPIDIYKKSFKLFFTAIIPFAFVNYYPILYLLDIKTNIFYIFTPLITFLYLLPSIFIFNLGLKKYTSTGS